VPDACLTVVTTAKMTAIPNATEKAAKTKRGTILRSLAQAASGPNLSPPFLLHAIIDDVWSVQDIQAPFDQFNDGNP
jgi:hypothetical protein